MGEAMSEGRGFAHAKARALLEVVRLAFEEGIGIDTEFPNYGTALQTDVERLRNNGVSHVKLKSEKEYAQNSVHRSHKPVSTGSSSRLMNGGPCMWCGVTATPQWRRPRGTNKLLCNACGIFFTRYGKLPEKNHQANHGVASQTAAAAATATQSAHAIAPPHTSSLLYAAEETRPVPGEADSNQADKISKTAAAADDGLRYKQEHSGLAQQSLQPQSQSQRMVWTCSSAVTSPHKRKDAPEPETQLLSGMEATPIDVDIDASPAPAAPAAVTAAFQIQALTAQPQVPVAEAAASGADAPSASSLVATALAAVDRPTSTVLTVAPLELGLQKINQMQHLGLLGPSLAGLGTLQACYLQGLTGAATVSAGANTGNSTMDAGRGVGLTYPALLQSYGIERVAAMSVLPFELLSRPFSLPIGLMPGGGAYAGAAMAMPPPRSPYVRPPKRQERFPVGESDDSNVSTDSHPVTNGDAGTSHEEDEGGTATTVSNVINTRENAAVTAGDTAPASSVAWHGGLSCSPPAPPAGVHFHSFIHARPAAAVPSTASGFGIGSGDGASLSLPPLALGAVPAPAGLAGPFGGMSSAARLLEQPQAILLEARRSKGPRNRASSATPSLSTLL